MSTPRFEAFLAKLYVDERARAAFLANPRSEALKAGLTDQEADALEKIDRTGLELTAQSLKRKRGQRFRKSDRK